MRRKPHPEADGMRVWMNGDELDQLIERMEANNGTPGAIAGRLGGHSGLRREEATDATANDVAETAGDPVLRVPDGKDGKYRETPIPADLADRMAMVAEYDDDIDECDPVLDIHPKTANRWVKKAASELADETGDPGWNDVTFHDLRRTWGTRMLEDGVLPSVVMSHGGWVDWGVFRAHYLGEFSPGALRRERAKVSWLNGDAVEDADIGAIATGPPTATPPTSSHQASDAGE